MNVEKKVALFVDVQNIYYTVRQAYSANFNYTAFWNQATQNRQVIKAYAYAIDRSDPQQINFQKIIHNIGFEIKLKPYIQRSDGSAKGDWDVGITIDMLEAAETADVIVLASGDGDFDLVIKKIQEKYRIPVEVYGVPSLTADSLIKAASVYTPIEESLLMRPKRS
ncbi:MAG: NYN domain-containing protein [Pseudomonadales bacterium]|nr:NYN domain-containing protein [Pseudomonadales bacterium]